MKAWTLNAGCGPDPWGEVRLDIARVYNRTPSTLNIVGDAGHLPFRSECMTMVKCSHVLEHLAEPSMAVQELKRVTTPGGVIEIAVPINDGFRENVIVGLLGLSWGTMRKGHWLRQAREHKWVIKRSWLQNAFSVWKVKVRYAGKIGEVCFLRSGRKGKLFRKALDYYRLPTNNWIGEWHLTAVKPSLVSSTMIKNTSVHLLK